MARPRETLGDRLTKSMKQGGLSVAEVAKAAGVHAVSVSRWRHDASVPDAIVLDRLAKFLRSKGQSYVTSDWLLHGAQSEGAVREPESRYESARSEIEFASPTAAQRSRIWLEEFLLELAESGAGEEFLASTRRLLLNPANYEHGFGAAAGARDEMDDEAKLKHMQALAVGVRAALKERLKGRK